MLTVHFVDNFRLRRSTWCQAANPEHAIRKVYMTYGWDSADCHVRCS